MERCVTTVAAGCGARSEPHRLREKNANDAVPVDHRILTDALTRNTSGLVHNLRPAAIDWKRRSKEEMAIKAEEQALFDVFSDRYMLNVGYYQRQYEWTKTQAGDLFSDLLNAIGEGDAILRKEFPSRWWKID